MSSTEMIPRATSEGQPAYLAELAECDVCGRNKPVCCDTGYRERPDGSVEHDDCACEDCCTNHHAPARTWPTYERMDCDQ